MNEPKLSILLHQDNALWRWYTYHLKYTQFCPIYIGIGVSDNWVILILSLWAFAFISSIPTSQNHSSAVFLCTVDRKLVECIQRIKWFKNCPLYYDFWSADVTQQPINRSSPCGLGADATATSGDGSQSISLWMFITGVNSTCLNAAK